MATGAPPTARALIAALEAGAGTRSGTDRLCLPPTATVRATPGVHTPVTVVVTPIVEGVPRGAGCHRTGPHSPPASVKATLNRAAATAVPATAAPAAPRAAAVQTASILLTAAGVSPPAHWGGGGAAAKAREGRHGTRGESSGRATAAPGPPTPPAASAPSATTPVAAATATTVVVAALHLPPTLPPRLAGRVGAAGGDGTRAITLTPPQARGSAGTNPSASRPVPLPLSPPPAVQAVGSRPGWVATAALPAASIAVSAPVRP